MFESGGLHYQWDPFATGFAFPGIPMGLGFVDPTPIATHMVSADALEGNYLNLSMRKSTIWISDDVRHKLA